MASSLAPVIFAKLLNINLKYLSIVLPLGISFFTFQTLSYVVDVYKKEVKASKNFFDFATYVSLFPQLVAGPIVRYSDIENLIKYNKKLKLVKPDV